MARRTAAYSPAEASAACIASAATKPSRPIIHEDEVSSDHLLSNPAGTLEEERRERRRAAACVHRLDPEHADLLLDALGLQDSEPEEEQPDHTWLSTTQVAQRIGGISSDQVRDWIHHGHVRAARTCPNGSWRVHPAEVARLAALVLGKERTA